MFSICVTMFFGNSQVITHNGPSIYLHLMILLTSSHSFHSPGPAEVVIAPNWLRILPGLVSPQWHSFLDVNTITIDLARIHRGCIRPCCTMCYTALHSSWKKWPKSRFRSQVGEGWISLEEMGHCWTNYPAYVKLHMSNFRSDFRGQLWKSLRSEPQPLEKKS